jgi:hypothetical protein
MNSSRYCRDQLIPYEKLSSVAIIARVAGFIGTVLQMLLLWHDMKIFSAIQPS